MKKTSVKLDLTDVSSFPKGRINTKRLDATTEEDIITQKQQDDIKTIQDMAKFARCVRKRLKMTQPEFSHCIAVSLNTIRNWEQGKRCPTGAAKTLLKILDKAPEMVSMVLR